jgi:signal transduction histidine kinase/ActR/RegA family two-component response regulator
MIPSFRPGEPPTTARAAALAARLAQLIRSPMSRILRLRLALMFAIALGLLAIIVIVSYQTTERFVAASEETAATSRLLLELERTLSTMRDLETGQQGYLITGDETYLKPYADALVRIRTDGDRLLALAAHRPSDAVRVAAIQRQINVKLNDLQSAIQARRQQGLEAARRISLTGRGKVAMDSLRKTIGDLEAEREAELRAQTAASSEGARSALANVIELALLAFLLLVFSCVLVVRYVRERLRVEAVLRAEGTALEGSVRARTAELERTAMALESESNERRVAMESVQRLNVDLGRRVSEFQTLLNVLPVGIAVADDPACERLLGNEAFEAMLGGSDGKSLGALPTVEPPYRILRNGLPVTPGELPMPRAAAGGRPVMGEEYDLVYQDGRVMHLLIYAAPLFDEVGQARGAVGAFLDVTAKRRAEEESQHAQKLQAIGQLAGGVAHDFNNILTAISSYTEFLLADLARGSPRRDDVVGIQEAAARAAALTQQLLAFGRKQVLQPTLIDVRELLDDTGRMLRRIIGEQINLSVVAGPILSPVLADRGQLSQVIVNLAVNARDAMPEGGRLTIEARDAPLSAEYSDQHLGVTPGPYVLIAVSDTGQGMSPAVKARMFEPFFTTKPRGKGTGLGLSTVFGIVKQSGGHIFVYSEVGHGTTIKVYLPRATEGVGTDGAVRQSVAAAGGVETVLLVEDEESVRKLARRALEASGYTVLPAASPLEALEIAARHQGHLDLLLTDVMMPDLNGRQLADRLTASRPGLAVLFMSGYAEDAIVHHGRLDPDTAFLQKPFAPETLAHKVRAMLDAHGRRAAANPA